MQTRVITIIASELGGCDFTANPQSTVMDIAREYDLFSYDFTVDGGVVPRDAWSSTLVFESGEIWATKGAKGAF